MAGRSYTVVHDGVHGSVRLDENFSGILDAPEMQRMAQIHQLGLANLVFPGANHTRLEHMIGTYHLASRFAGALEIRGQERDILLASALVHDVGHPPFSHTFETILQQRLGINHMEQTAKIIRGETSTVPGAERHIAAETGFLARRIEGIGLDTGEIAELVMNEHGVRGLPHYLTSLIHGPVDVDQLDYLMRDSHYTGVGQGRVDADRIVETSEIIGKSMVVQRRGISAVEGLIVSRILMNSAVYFHKTVRIAEMMLTKAVSMLDRSVFPDVFMDTDASLSCRLGEQGGYQREIALRLKYRRLFKTALLISLDRMGNEERRKLASLSRRGKLFRLEDEISAIAGGVEGSVIIDAAPVEFLTGRGRKGKTEVPILDDDGRVRKLTSLSTIARAVQKHPQQDWGLLVACDPAIRGRVSRISREMILG
jgi:HD superfamily phosphohydrolase